jgi:FOG: GAF domain
VETIELAFNLQRQWLECSLQAVHSTTGQAILQKLMRRIMQDLIQISKADEGSIFLVDDMGRVIEGVLARGQVQEKYRQLLIGEVLDKGFAGWVLKYRTFGLIEDTRHDSRWWHLPDQPYTALSALGVPLLFSDMALGVLTLMHHQTGHFSQKDVHLVQLLHDPMALLIENARLHALNQK